MDDDTRNYLDALDRLANGSTHQDRSVAAVDLHALGVKSAELGRDPGDDRG